MRQPLAAASTANKDWNRTVDLLRTAGAISFEGYAWYRLVRYSRSLVDLPSDLTLAKSPNEPMKKYSPVAENRHRFSLNRNLLTRGKEERRVKSHYFTRAFIYYCRKCASQTTFPVAPSFNYKIRA